MDTCATGASVINGEFEMGSLFEGESLEWRFSALFTGKLKNNKWVRLVIFIFELAWDLVQFHSLSPSFSSFFIALVSKTKPIYSLRSPGGLGQPWVKFFDTFSVGLDAAVRTKKMAMCLWNFV